MTRAQMTRATYDRLELSLFVAAHSLIGCSAAILPPSLIMGGVLAAYYLLTPILVAVAWATWRAHAARPRRSLR